MSRILFLGLFVLASFFTANAWSQTATVSPNPSTTGDFTISWTSGYGNVSVTERVPGTSGLVIRYWGERPYYNVTGRASGTYTYVLLKDQCNPFSGCTSQQFDSVTVTVARPVAPSVPGAISAPGTANTGSYTVSWGASSGALTSYELQQRANGGGWSPAPVGTSRSKSYTKSQNNYYDYRVRACNQGICSGYTSSKRVNIPKASITAGTSLNLSSRSDDTFTLTWSSAMTSSCSWNKGTLPGASGSISTSITSGWTANSSAPMPMWDNSITINCSIYSGGTVTKTIQLQVASLQPKPSVSVSWSASTAYVGQPITFSWSSSEADSCILDGANVSKNGSRSYTFTSTNSVSKTVKCTNEMGSTSRSKTTGVTYPTPGVPSSISVPSTASKGSYSVSWGGSSGSITTYQLEQRINGGGWSSTDTGSSRSRSYSKTQNSYYDYRVRACFHSVCSGYTSTKRVTVPAASITTSFSPTILSRTDNTFTLTWSSVMTTGCSWSAGAISGTSGSKGFSQSTGWVKMPFDGPWENKTTLTCSVINGGTVKKYLSLTAHTLQPKPSVNVNWNTSAANVGQAVTLSWSTSDADNCSLDGASVGTSGSRAYTFTSSGTVSKSVSCSNEMGSTSKSKTIAVSYPKPGVPSSFSVPSTASNSSYTVSWGASSGTVTTYKIEESINGSSWSSLNTNASRSKGYSKTQNTYYDYRVRACYNDSCGGYTATKRVTVPAASVTITAGLSSNWNTDDVILSWNSVMVSGCSWNNGALPSANGSISEPLNSGWIETPGAGGSMYHKNTVLVQCNVFGGGTVSAQKELLSIGGPKPSPAVSVWWDESSVLVGSSAILTWSSSYADSCTVEGESVGSSGTNGSRPYTLSSAGTQTRQVTCTSARGNGSASDSIVVKHPAPYFVSSRVVSSRFGDTPVTVAASNEKWGFTDVAMTLEWDSRHTTGCYIVVGNIAQYNLDSIDEFTLHGRDLTWVYDEFISDWRYTTDLPLICLGLDGAELRSVVTLSAAFSGEPRLPTATTQWQETEVDLNGNAHFTWSSEDAESCRLNGSDVAESGARVTTFNSDGPHIWSLTCENAEGSDSSSASINVRDFYLGTQVRGGNAVSSTAAEIIVDWTAINVSECSINNQSINASAGSGSVVIDGVAAAWTRSGSQWQLNIPAHCLDSNNAEFTRDIVVTTSLRDLNASVSWLADVVMVDQEATFGWNVADAQSCTDWNGLPLFTMNGSVTEIFSTEGEHTYFIDCLDQAGESHRLEAAVSVNAFPIPIDPADDVTGDATFLGYTEGSFKVGGNGAASYTVPVVVSPGIQGVQPNLSISYSSSGSNGLMGWGWSLSGLSHIHRCAASIIRDEYISSTMDGSDYKLCLNGQRLVEVAEGEYRTERESYRKIVENEFGGFNVHSKNGRVIEYGGRVNAPGDLADARRDSADGLGFIDWSISRVTDVAGNYMTYHYEKDGANGIQRIERIEYTKNDDAIAINQSVNFVYEERDDNVSGYWSGVYSQMDKRLERIDVRSDDILVRSYQLGYQAFDGTTYADPARTSRLESIAICYDVAGSECSTPISIDWTSRAANDFVFSESKIVEEDSNFRAVLDSYGPNDGFKYVLGDFDADGIQELIYKSGLSVYRVAKGGIPSYAEDQRVATFTPHTDDRSAHLTGSMDLNHDGRDDLIFTHFDIQGLRQILVGYANETGFDETRISLFADTAPEHGRYKLKFKDMDGDGLIDLLAYPEWVPPENGVVFYRISKNLGDGTFLPFVELVRHAGSEPVSSRFVDMNGDGLTDIVRCGYITHDITFQDENKCRFIVALNEGEGGFSEPAYWGNTQIDSVPWFIRKDLDPIPTHNFAQHMIFADVNGDGLADVIFSDHYDVKVAINNGQHLEDFEIWLDQGIADRLSQRKALPFSVADFNADGKPDLIFGEVGGVQIAYNKGASVGLAQGGGFSVPQSLGLDVRGYEFGLSAMDVNDDGVTDLGLTSSIVNLHENLAYLNILQGIETATNQIQKHLVTAINVADERSIDIRYLPLTDTSIHTPGESNAVLDASAAPLAVLLEDVVGGDAGEGSFTLLSTVRRSHYVVERVESDDGIGGNNVSTYHYTGHLSHRRGWGSLGFAEIEVNQVIQGTGDRSRTVTEYSQDFGRLYKASGLPLRTINYAVLAVGEQKLSETVYEWNVQELEDDIDGINSPHYIVQRVAVHSTTQDLNGAALADISSFVLAYDATVPANCTADPEPILTVDQAALPGYDSYGNILQSVVLTCGSDQLFTTSSQFVYENRTSQDTWHLGLVTNRKTTKTAPDAEGGLQSLAREISNTYHDSGLAHIETREPNNTDLMHSKALNNYDSYGAPGTIMESWNNADGLGFTTRSSQVSVAYQSNGAQTIVTTNALGHQTTSLIEGKFGQIKQFTDSNNLTTVTTFDSLGRVDTIKAPDDSTVVNRYLECSTCDAQSNFARSYVHMKATAATPQRSYFDTLGRDVGQRVLGLTGEVSHTVLNYDAAGRVTRMSKPFFVGGIRHDVTYKYDRLGRVTQVYTPGGGTTVTQHNGLEVTSTNVLGQQRVQWLNVIGQNIITQDDAGTQIEYVYDPFSNLIQTEVGATGSEDGVITRMGYDLLGRQRYLEDPSIGRINYTYNGLDLMVTSTDAENQRTEFSFDTLGREVMRVDDAGAANADLRTHEWFFDTASSGKGRLDRVSGYDSDGFAFSERYGYNSYGLPTTLETTIQGETYFTETHYDSFNRHVGIEYPTGYTVVNHYNEYGYRHQISNGLDEVPLWTATSADAQGNIISSIQGNGVVTTRGFEEDTGFVNSIHALGRNNLVVQNHEFSYDLLGNLKTRTDMRLLNGTGYTQGFCYDNLNRLRATSDGSCGESDSDDTTYDALGNIITRMMVGVGMNTHTYDSANPYKLTSATIGGSYGYDANGSIVSGDGRTISYTSFDKPNRMTKDGNVVEITYGADQNRIKRVDNGSITTTYVAGIYEKREEGGIVEHIHYVGDIALHVWKQESNASAMTYTRYLHHDHIGSLVAKTNELAETTDDVEWMASDPWGLRQDESWLGSILDTSYQPADMRKGFTGHEHMDGVGLIHMNGRVYDPNIARFLSADPIVQAPDNTQNFNRYAYVYNNPLRYTDPSGFQVEDSLLCPPARCSIIQISQPTQNIADLDIKNLGAAGFFYRDENGRYQHVSTLDTLSVVSGVAGGLEFVHLRATAGKFTAAATYTIDGAQIAGADPTLGGHAPQWFIEAVVPGAGAMMKLKDGDAKGAATDMVMDVTKVKWGKAIFKNAKEFEGWVRGLFKKVKCFVPGTLVLMADGSTKPIEDIVAGEWVMGDNPEDNKPPKAYIVTDILESQTNRIIRITLDDDDGFGGSIESTGKHPYWTENRGWQYAENIQAGDVFRDENGGINSVVSVETEFRESPTYNLTVDQVHTYFVVTEGKSVLVHNIDPFEIEFTRSVDLSESFQRGPLKGRTLASVIAETKRLGRLPAGLNLNAARSFTAQGGQVIEAINNRTLFVAQQAGLSNVNPANDIDSAKAYNQVQKQKKFALKSGKNICP